MKGILGRKIGMTQVFTEKGNLIPVTVVSVEDNVVTQIKTKENDGYDAIQLGSGTKRDSLANKPEIGHLKKANTAPKRFLKEIKGVEIDSYHLGDIIKADIFTEGEMVDVTGTSKGKGFQGVIKRHNQSRGPMGHGSQYHRGVGSMGTMRPMRVMKGKNLPGHMGHETVTIQNLEIVLVNLEDNVILIKGNIPGAKNSLVFIRTAIKNPNIINETEVLINYDANVSDQAETNSTIEMNDVNEDVTVESTEVLNDEVEISSQEVTE